MGISVLKARTSGFSYEMKFLNDVRICEIVYLLTPRGRENISDRSENTEALRFKTSRSLHDFFTRCRSNLKFFVDSENIVDT